MKGVQPLKNLKDFFFFHQERAKKSYQWRLFYYRRLRLLTITMIKLLQLSSSLRHFYENRYQNDDGYREYLPEKRGTSRACITLSWSSPSLRSLLLKGEACMKCVREDMKKSEKDRLSPFSPSPFRLPFLSRESWRRAILPRPICLICRGQITREDWWRVKSNSSKKSASKKWCSLATIAYI